MNREISLEEAKRIVADNKEHEDFVKMMGDTIGFEQPDGSVKYSKLEYLG